jgi:hypothetical protein
MISFKSRHDMAGVRNHYIIVDKLGDDLKYLKHIMKNGIKH